MITTLPVAGASAPRVAYAVPRTVGSAVVRNRLRRRLRAVTATLDLSPGAYLISASPAAAGLSFDELAGHVREASGR